MTKKICIYSNKSRTSIETLDILRGKLGNAGFQCSDSYTGDEELMICIGGDGTFLEAMHRYNFPGIPIIGVNTGHLGFFQEIMPDQLDSFVEDYVNGNYSLQQLSTVKITVDTGQSVNEHIGLNEVVIRGSNYYNIHLNLSIDGCPIERFSGDGLLVATPAGSTAYNYSLGGSIVDPRLNLLQVTPMAPMNTTAYRSFTSSILLPGGGELSIVPDMDYSVPLAIVRDGYVANYDTVRQINIGFSDLTVRLIRFEGYDFWTKVKSKFL